MLLASVAVAFLTSSELVSPLQVCTGDRINIERRYNMHASGHVTCSVGDVVLHGGNAAVSANADESALEVVVTGGAKVIRGRETVRGDRIAATMERAGNQWVLSRLVVDYFRARITPAEGAR